MATFQQRAVGMYTGSRSAAAAGRIPLIDVAQLHLRHWQQSGLNVHGHRLGLATFVDNLFTIAASPETATQILDDCSSMLHDRWGLQIGAASKEYLTRKGYPRHISVHPSWQRRTTMRVLGHQLDDDGGTSSCSRGAIASMKRAFYGNLTPGLRRSGKAAKLRFLDSSVRSIARFRWPRWPFTRELADKLDACQRKFLYALFPVQPRLDEQIDEFFARRHRAASRLASASGRWSTIWLGDLRKWHAHVQRKHDPHTWSHHLLDWKGHQWLTLQRLWNSARGESRTGTRVSRGKPRRRWEEGLLS